MAKEVREININHIKPHPDNPRKDVGDVSELAKSIRINGIMQNLTIVPAAEGFKCLIGHRRLAAAKKAGLETVPCIIIEGLSLQEQVAIMLEENMQREDLTVPEQAESFQLMLDLGATIDDLKETTGFSESTIRHRLNLAKLDKELLQDAVHEYQITLTDLIELEKIDDIEERNRILADSRDHNQIVNKVAIAIKEKKRKEHAKKVIFLLESQKIKEAPKNTNKWANNVSILHEISIDDEEKPKTSYPDNGGELCYINGSNAVWNPTITVVEISEPVKEEKPKPTKEEVNKKELNQYNKALASHRRQAIELLIEKRTKYRGDKDITMILYEFMEKMAVNVNAYYGGDWMSQKKSWEMSQDEREQWRDKFAELPVTTRMIILIERVAKDKCIYNYDCTYDEYNGPLLKEWHEILRNFGLTSGKLYDEVLDGSSPLYINN